jgi:Na+/melibiose symporter-like transporter
MILANYSSATRFTQYMNRKLGALGLAILGFAMLCLFFAFLRVFVLSELQPSLSPFFLKFNPVFSILCIVLGFLLFGLHVIKAPNQPKLQQKLVFFEESMILYWTCLSVAMAVNLMAYILTSNKIFLLFFLGVVMFVGIFRPSLDNCIRYLQLSDIEVDLLDSNANILEYDTQFDKK